MWNTRPLFFIFIFIFSPDSPTEVTRAWILAQNSSKHALWGKEVPLGGPHNGRQHFGVQISPKPSKVAFYKHVLAWANGLETNDVIEGWRHWLARGSLAVISGAAYTIYSILEITAAVYFPVIKQYIRYGNSVLAPCVGNLLCRVSHKMIPCSVLLESFKNFETLIRKRRTLGEPFDLAQIYKN